MFDMAKTAAKIVDDILQVKEGETIVIVHDTYVPEKITYLLAFITSARGASPVLVKETAHIIGGQEPSKPVAAALLNCDAAIMQCKYALVHTNGFRKALEAGVRLVDMWGVTEDMMLEGGLLADVAEVNSVTGRIGSILKSSTTARLTTPSGTDLSVDIKGRPVIALGAGPAKPGEFCALPGGEVTVSPIEGSAKGILVDPFLLERREIGYRRDPLKIQVQDGMVKDISGGREARALIDLLDKMGQSARNIAEFAIGTNAWCRPYESFREAKKTLGTAHVALGDNKTLGGNVDSPMHMDMIFEHPTVVFDDKVVLRDGKLVV
jgi:leucyl aminopeptidase (aminopeptidase T)